MSKLVDLKRLQQLAEALDSRMKAKVSAEESRAKGVESGLDGRIGTLEGQVDALIAGTYDDSEVRGLISDNADAIAAIVADYLKAADKAALEGSIAGVSEVAQAAKDKIDAFMLAAEVQGEAIDTLKEIQEYISSDAAAAEQMLASIASKVSQEAYDAKVAELEAADAQVLVDAKAYADQAELDAVAAAEAKDAALKAELEGQIKVKADQSALKDVDDRVKDLEDAKDDYKSYADAAEADAIASAKAYADGELAKKADASAVYTKEEVNSSINTVLGEVERLEENFSEQIGKKADADKVYSKEAADAKFLTEHQDISALATKAEVEAEKSRAMGIEGQLQNQIDAINNGESGILAEAKAYADQAKADAIADAAGKDSALKLELEGKISAAEQAAKTYALEQDVTLNEDLTAKISKKVDKVEGKSLVSDAEIARLAQVDNYDDTELVGKVSALEQFQAGHKDYDDTAIKERLVALEAIDHEYAAADEALHATIKAEMSAVVSSLNAEITEAGTLKLSLGGGSTVATLCEKELPFATDAEIAAIIAGLDD